MTPTATHMPPRPLDLDDKPAVYVPDLALPPAWLFDLDGTLALNTSGRDWYDYMRSGEDSPHGPVVEIALALAATGAELVAMTGRDDSCRDITLEWAARHGVHLTALYMRPTGSREHDVTLKRDLFLTHVAPHWNVKGVFEDRNSVVAMWREMGLVCMQVAPGDF